MTTPRKAPAKKASAKAEPPAPEETGGNPATLVSSIDGLKEQTQDVDPKNKKG